MKSVNLQLDFHNWLEATQINENLFEVRVSQDGKVSVFFLSNEELKTAELQFLSDK